MFYVVESTVTVERHSCPAYGIGWGEDWIDDLCLEKERMDHFVNACNSGGLSVLQVRDAAEDFVNGGCLDF